jgi:hypothetical protein
MKTPYKLLIAGLALLVANLACASATMKDVETAVRISHDYRQAESLIREVVASDPGNARDHYVYSQILQHNGKHDDAVHELAEAKRLDPAIKFDKDPQRVSDYEASLNAGGEHRPTFAPQPQTERFAPGAMEAQPVEPEHHPGHTLLWVVLILGITGVAGYFFYRRVQEHDRLEDEGRMNLVRQDQMKQASALLESVKPLKLDIRMANPANPALLAEVDDAEKELVDLVERLGKLPVPQSEIDWQAENLAHLRRAFEGKPDPVAPEQPEYENPQYGDPGGFGRPPTGPVYPQSGPVYVQNNNGGSGMGGGLLAGLALGSLMGGGHDREVIHEIRETPERRNDNDDTSGSQSDIDFGNDDGDSGGGGIDFGSDDS